MRSLSALVVLILLASACASGPSAPPEAAVPSYLQALLNGDAEAVFRAVCPQWEDGAQRDLDAFSGVTGSLQDARCTRAGISGSYTLVTCTGTMQINYRGELRDRPLAGQVYRVVEIDNTWKMCGYE